MGVLELHFSEMAFNVVKVLSLALNSVAERLTLDHQGSICLSSISGTLSWAERITLKEYSRLNRDCIKYQGSSIQESPVQQS